MRGLILNGEIDNLDQEQTVDREIIYATSDIAVRKFDLPVCVYP